MAQRHTSRSSEGRSNRGRSNGGRTVIGFQKVEMPKPRRRKPGNDNTKTSLSGLSFQEQRARKKSAADLSWQVRFAKMKLHHWHNPDNTHWDPLAALLKAAEAKQMRLGPV